MRRRLIALLIFGVLATVFLPANAATTHGCSATGATIGQCSYRATSTTGRLVWAAYRVQVTIYDAAGFRRLDEFFGPGSLPVVTRHTYVGGLVRVIVRVGVAKMQDS